MAKGGMLKLPGRPNLLMEGRGRRGARTALDSDWFDLDKDGIVARLRQFGLAEDRAEKEADAFLDYRVKLREVETEPAKETLTAETSRVIAEWEKAQQKRRQKDGE